MDENFELYLSTEFDVLVISTFDIRNLRVENRVYHLYSEFQMLKPGSVRGPSEVTKLVVGGRKF